MIIKKRTKPQPLKKLDALLPRLSPKFPHLASLQAEAAKRHKGYIGEQKADYHLEKLDQNYTILQDLCLDLSGQTFQIDALILTSRAIYCIEMKNFNNQIIFNTNLNQFSRSDGQIETGFSHPIVQAENHQLQLQKWLSFHSLPGIPVYYFVAISDPATVIKVIGDETAIGKTVTHAAFLPQKIAAHDSQLQTESIDHRKIGAEIARACKTYDYDILRKYSVKPEDILPGVHCPACGRLGMERMYDGWKCMNCDSRRKRAHMQALSDYFLLIKPAITNSACMHWLNIDSRNTATRILKKSNLGYDKKRRRWEVAQH